MAGSVKVLNDKLFQYLFWGRLWRIVIFRYHITFGESFCIICSEIAIIKNSDIQLLMSSQDRRKRSSPRTSSSSSRSTESLSGHSSEKNQHRENSSGRKNNSGKVCALNALQVFLLYMHVFVSLCDAVTFKACHVFWSWFDQFQILT